MTRKFICRHDDWEMQSMFMSKLKINHLPAGATFLALRTEDQVLGGFMFERYTGKGGVVHSHQAANAKGWLDRKFLSAVADYVFNQLGCNAVIGETPLNDSYVIRINEKLGFKFHTYIEGYFPDGDLAIYKMTREECRWLPAGPMEARNHG